MPHCLFAGFLNYGLLSFSTHLLFILFSVQSTAQCQYHPDCRSNEVCHTGTCVDACLISSCGINALCTAQQHDIACVCRPGYTGDPLNICIPSKNVSILSKEYACDLISFIFSMHNYLNCLYMFSPS